MTRQRIGGFMTRFILGLITLLLVASPAVAKDANGWTFIFRSDDPKMIGV